MKRSLLTIALIMWAGILAIYGSKLGAEEILAIDIDMEAINWAEKNIDLNGCKDKIILSEKKKKKIYKPFTLITANLIFSTILEVVPVFKKVLSENGWLILSGLLNDQIEPVMDTLKVNNFMSQQVLYEEEWVCMIVSNIDATIHG